MYANLKGQYAGFVSRLIAYSIDLGVISICIVAISWTISTAINLLPGQDLIIQNTGVWVVLAGAGAFLFTAGYYTLFWAGIGKTPGKILLGVRVVNLEGGSITFLQAIIRFFGYILSMLALFAGYWWILLDNRRQGWHDKLARTFVVYDWDAKPGDYISQMISERPNDVITVSESADQG